MATRYFRKNPDGGYGPGSDMAPAPGAREIGGGQYYDKYVSGGQTYQVVIPSAGEFALNSPATQLVPIGEAPTPNVYSYATNLPDPGGKDQFGNPIWRPGQSVTDVVNPQGNQPGGPLVDYGQGFQPLTRPFNTPINLTSDIIKPTTQIPYASVPQPSTGQLQSLSAPAYSALPAASTQQTALQPYEQQKSDLIQRILGEQKQLVGESAYRAQQEQTQGISGKVQTVNDLTNQLNALKAEQASIVPQTELAAQGAGITTTILGRQQQALLRQNAIKALSVSALLQAAQGNLATAQDLADRAVRAQFDPIKEQIAVDRANLETLSQDPNLTIEQQNRITAQNELKARQNDAVN